MIKINKDVEVPDILTNQGVSLRRKMETKYDENPDGYTGSNPEKFSYRPNIYGHASVKEKLKECQHNKCCYTEARFEGDFPHVEHFRPKGGVNKELTKELLYPGYYWLAYEWDNLFLSKSRINVSHKRNLFPLDNESKRARNHHQDIANEVPLLIDPGREDPREHIRFHNDEPIACKGSTRGDVTIKVLNLRHPDLAYARQQKIIELILMKDALEVFLSKGINDNNNKVIKDIYEAMSKAVLSEAEFSSMAIDYLSKNNML